MNSHENLETKKIYGEIEEIVDGVETRFNCFKNFDINIYPPYDHRFREYDDPVQMTFKPSFTERVVQEWTLLEENLPNSGFYIRVNERRIDLIRAVLIGPQGSPYQDCLFVFDISLPKSYPSVPPKVVYHSYGLDMSPTLREDGGVRLTILETKYKRLMNDIYRSTTEEKWEPKASNLLHVLYAIKNSIVSLKPDSPKTAKRSLSDNKVEQSIDNKRWFELKCENMMRVLKNPPMDFECFVAGHFRKRAHHVLLEFKENKDHSQLMMDLFVSLLQVFERNGTYCKHHLDFLKSNAKTET